ncbi:MAG: hypothetical protein WDZ63_09790, partial [Burkholderiales bacterium]
QLRLYPTSWKTKFRGKLSSASLQTVEELDFAGVAFDLWSMYRGSEVERVLLTSPVLVSSWLRTAKSARGLTMLQEVIAILESETNKKKEILGTVEQLQPIVRRFLRDHGIVERVVSGQEQDDVYLSCVVDAPARFEGILVSIIFSESERRLTVQGKLASSVEFTPAFITAWSDDKWQLQVSRSTGRFSWSLEDGSGVFLGNCEAVSKTRF